MLFGYPHPVPYLDYRWRLGLVGTVREYCTMTFLCLCTAPLCPSAPLGFNKKRPIVVV